MKVKPGFVRQDTKKNSIIICFAKPRNPLARELFATDSTDEYNEIPKQKIREICGNVFLAKAR